MRGQEEIVCLGYRSEVGAQAEGRPSTCGAEIPRLTASGIYNFVEASDLSSRPSFDGPKMQSSKRSYVDGESSS